MTDALRHCEVARRSKPGRKSPKNRRFASLRGTKPSRHLFISPWWETNQRIKGRTIGLLTRQALPRRPAHSCRTQPGLIMSIPLPSVLFLSGKCPMTSGKAATLAKFAQFVVSFPRPKTFSVFLPWLVGTWYTARPIPRLDEQRTKYGRVLDEVRRW